MLVSDELGGGVFDHTPVSFDLAVPEGIVLSLFSFDLAGEQLAADLALAAAVGEAYGATPTVSVGAGAPDGRTISVLAPAPDPDWDAIRALVDDGDAQLSWAFPGVSFEGGVPGPDVTDLVDSIGGVVPLGADALPWVLIDWYGDGVVVSFIGEGVDVADPISSALWPEAVQVAALIGASSLAARSFMFYGPSNGGVASAYFGACAEPVVLTDADTALATALESAGVENARPGQCLR